LDNFYKISAAVPGFFHIRNTYLHGYSRLPMIVRVISAFHKNVK
jgi:hypothetical protein